MGRLASIREEVLAISSQLWPSIWDKELRFDRPRFELPSLFPKFKDAPNEPPMEDRPYHPHRQTHAYRHVRPSMLPSLPLIQIKKLPTCGALAPPLVVHSPIRWRRFPIID